MTSSRWQIKLQHESIYLRERVSQMGELLARAQLPIKAKCNPLSSYEISCLLFFSAEMFQQDLNFPLDRKIYSFIGVEKMQHGL